MRLFVGVEIPESEKRKIVQLKKGISVKGRVKWVEEENLHITILFIGESEPEEIIRLLDGIEHEFKPFEARLSGVSAFPSLSRPRVLWVGLEKGEEELKELHKKVYNRLKHIVKLENRFIPHVTFGRVKYGRVGFTSLHLRNPEDFTIDGLILFQSRLTPEGPVYSVVKRYISGGE